MATLKLGKLKINKSEEGFAYRFGDGEIHRLRFGRKRQDAAPEYDYDEAYQEGDYGPDGYGDDDYVADGYSGRFSQPSPRNDYADDRDFADDDRDFDDRDYDDRDYDDREYADDDGYEDDRYYDEDGSFYDEDGEYDDRYLDEDADAYGDEAYADENPVLRYIDENDWVTYLLLFILPPLGIYLLWRRHRFDQPIRIAISAVSAIWFIIVIVLLVSAIFSGSGDSKSTPTLTMVTPTPTVAVETTPTPDASADAFAAASPDASASPNATQDLLAADPTATPIAGMSGTVGSTGGSNVLTSADTVIMSATGVYYHSSESCVNIEAGASLSTVTKEVAVNQGKAPCPLCYPNQKIYYATANGTYYHVTQDCSGMTGATTITKEAAEEAGKKPCPACIQGKVESVSTTGLRYATSSTTDKSGITVWATAGGKYFHNNSTCSGMAGATSGSLLQALLAGKKACPTCCASAGVTVYATKNGTYYHSKSDCSGMVGAYTLSVGEALVLGKKSCPTCMTGSSGSTTPSTVDDGSGVYVYGTPNGKYYHTNSTCSGMTGATRYTLKSMLLSKRAACPVCCSGADTVVYATKNGTYYHSYATCSGMKNAEAGTLAAALAYGYKKCPSCWNSSSGSTSTTGGSSTSGNTGSSGGSTTSTTGSSTSSSSSSSGNYVYCTVTSKHYHTNATCSGMTGASRVTVAQAVAAGKTACSTCASAAKRTVYSYESGTYFHATSSCNGQTGIPKRTLEDALALGQKACPTCKENYKNGTLNTSSDKATSAPNMVSSGKFDAGTSGIKVYASADDKYFHTTSSHAGSNASRVTLETALNYGKKGCPSCASSANTTVYAVKGGKYYHYSKTCAGDGASSGTRAEALAYGFDPCPYCVTKTQTVEVKDTYKAGTSGIKVYASISGKHYHTDKTCAGSSASYITLETALNYGKTPCPSCAASAGKTVYSSASDKYYHSSKTCAGDDAIAGDFAKALALGKKECPICIGGSEAYEESDIKYSAPGDTPVYVDLDSDLLYYHNSSRCSDAGLSGGTKVTLEFVLQMKYRACPFCAPPTSVE